MSFKRYTGSAWADVSSVKRYNGSAWVDCDSVKRYNGSAWVDVWTNVKWILSGCTRVPGQYIEATINSANQSMSAKIDGFSYTPPASSAGNCRVYVDYEIVSTQGTGGRLSSYIKCGNTINYISYNGENFGTTGRRNSQSIYVPITTFTDACFGCYLDDVNYDNPKPFTIRFYGMYADGVNILKP